MRILLIEDDKISRISLTEMLQHNGYQVTACATGKEALKEIDSHTYDAVLTDLRLPQVSGLDLLKVIRQKNPDCPVILMTAYASVESAVQALKLGAYDYLTKPFSPDELLSMLKRIQEFQQVKQENIQLKKRIRSFEQRELIGQSPVMRHLREQLRLIAQNDSTVLIQGESGTGKEVVARFLHQQSARRNVPFVAINCAALPETLLESELFGYEKGAFTGANHRHVGYIESAHEGVLFIDDIDDLPMSLQIKLLRFLQEREIQRIGGRQTIPINTRVIAATKKDLRQLIKEKAFREDLYYRLNIIPIYLPPLRERKEDIPQLIEHFFQKHAQNRPVPPLTEEILQKMMAYNWPGNVRELENMVERMIALPQAFNWPFSQETGSEEGHSGFSAQNEQEFPGLPQYLRQQERQVILSALKKHHYHLSRTAQYLKIPRTTLKSKMVKLGITLPGK